MTTHTASSWPPSPSPSSSTGRYTLDEIFTILNVSPTRRMMVREDMSNPSLRQGSIPISINQMAAATILKGAMNNQRVKNDSSQDRLSDAILNNTFGRGNSLVFSVLPNGEVELIDGQNRLGAVVEAGTKAMKDNQPAKSVSFGVGFVPCETDFEIKQEAMRTDNHNTRGNSDLAMIAGIPKLFEKDPQYIGHVVPKEWSKKIVGAAKILIRYHMDLHGRFKPQHLRDPDQKLAYYTAYWSNAVPYLNTCIYGTPVLTPVSQRVKNPIRQKTLMEGRYMSAGLLIFNRNPVGAADFFRTLSATTKIGDIDGPLGGIDSYLTRGGFDGLPLTTSGANAQLEAIYTMCRAFIAFENNEEMSEGLLKSYVRWKLNHGTGSGPFHFSGYKPPKKMK